jgi:hypothetical protein
LVIGAVVASSGRKFSGSPQKLIYFTSFQLMAQ